MISPFGVDHGGISKALRPLKLMRKKPPVVKPAPKPMSAREQKYHSSNQLGR